MKLNGSFQIYLKRGKDGNYVLGLKLGKDAGPKEMALGTSLIEAALTGEDPIDYQNKKFVELGLPFGINR